MTSPIELVVTDLDGTFWHTDDHLDDDVRRAVKELEARDIPLLVATGRRLNSTRRPLAAFGLAPPAIVLNGALGVDLATGERFLVSPYADGEAALVLRAFREVGLDPVVYVDDVVLEAYVSTTPSTHPGHLKVLEGNVATDDLERVTAEEPILGFSLIGVEHGDAVAAQKAIGSLAETHLDRSIDFPGMATFTVAPNDQSKWDGVVAFCSRMNIDSTRVLALGDGTNDIELLEEARVALAPTDGHSSARALATATIPSAKEGGWAAVLDYL